MWWDLLFIHLMVSVVQPFYLNNTIVPFLINLRSSSQSCVETLIHPQYFQVVIRKDIQDSQKNPKNVVCYEKISLHTSSERHCTDQTESPIFPPNSFMTLSLPFENHEVDGLCTTACCWSWNISKPCVFSSDNISEKEENLAPSLVYIKNHFHPCIATLLHQQSVLAAAQCYLPSLKIMVGNFSKKFKDRTEQTIDSIQIIHYWNLTTGSSKHLNKVFLTTISSKSFISGVTTCAASSLDGTTLIGGGKQLDLKKNFKASLVTEKECQKTEPGKVIIKNKRFMKSLKSFKRLCVQTWKWYWLLSSAVTRFRGGKSRHFLGDNISLYIDIFQYILCIQKIVYRLSYFYSF
uniref:Probable inactive serine protease 37 n=1 Tax=Monodelphis domestica TaxID=13616 RepID=A0A5F8HF28_MONDO